MANFISQELAQLIYQAQYAPVEKKLSQVDACETLIRLIQPAGKYPYEFICFHLTGYRPKSKKEAKLIDYKTLVHDLSIYSEQLSKTFKTSYKDIKTRKKPITIDQISQKFKVCPKTISRWRRQGLIGRYLVYPDGRRRLAFFSGSVDYFVKTHRIRVEKSKAFRQSDTNERQAIIKRLLQWSRYRPDQRQEAIRRTARKFKRSTETIRLILTFYEKEISPQRLFVKRTDYIDSEKRGEICDLFEQGWTIAELVSRYGRSRSNIYRAINLHQAAQLEGKKIRYMDSGEFGMAGAKEKILNASEGLFEQLTFSELSAESANKIITEKDIETKNSRVDSGTGKDIGQSPHEANKHKLRSDLGAYSADIAQNTVLTQVQEHFLFRKYNYLKYLAGHLQARINYRQPQGRLVRKARELLRQADNIKQILIRCNLRLVVSTARRHTRNEAEMMELISEGNLAVMNTVEKFDFTRGNKFSTYATWALVKRFATLRTTQMRRQEQTIPDEMMEVTHDTRVVDNRVVAVESARKDLQTVMEDTLEEREKVIVREHYGLLENEKVVGRRKAKSLSQISQLVGLSKERVRQIELAALQKLRRVLSPEEFDVLVEG